MKEKARNNTRASTATPRIERAAETPPADTRPIDDPARLAEEARATVDKNASEIRKQRVPIATEPPTVYRP